MTCQTILTSVLSAERKVDLPLGELQADFGLRSCLRALQGLKVWAHAKGASTPIGRRIRNWSRAVEWSNFKRRRVGPAADDPFKAPALGSNLELGRAHSLPRLQGRDATAKQLDFRHFTASHAGLIEVGDFIERGRILAGEREILLRELQIDKRLLHVEFQSADRIENVRFGNRPFVLGHGDPPSALGTTLEKHIEPEAVFGRAGAVDVVESGANQIEVIAAKAHDGIGAKLRGDQVGFGDGDSGARCNQLEVLLERFGDGCVYGKARREGDSRCWCLRRNDRRNDDEDPENEEAGESHRSSLCSPHAVDAELEKWRESTTEASLSVRFARGSDGVPGILHGQQWGVITYPRRALPVKRRNLFAPARSAPPASL